MRLRDEPYLPSTTKRLLRLTVFLFFLLILAVAPFAILVSIAS